MDEVVHALAACELPQGVVVLDDVHHLEDPAALAFPDHWRPRMDGRWALRHGFEPWPHDERARWWALLPVGPQLPAPSRWSPRTGPAHRTRGRAGMAPTARAKPARSPCPAPHGPA